MTEEQKETVIQFDEESSMATVYTSNWITARNLEKVGFQPIRQKEGALVVSGSCSSHINSRGRQSPSQIAHLKNT